VQGAMLLWPRVVCGSTAVPLSSPCPLFPSCLCMDDSIFIILNIFISY
jgi:hypothetical protein